METKVKHTPGPWQICYDGQIDGLNGDKVCSGMGFESYKEFQDDGVLRANALLIAAAPDLLEAAKLASTSPLSYEKWMPQIVAAITKAEVKEIR